MSNKNQQETYEYDFPLERVFPTASARVLDYLILNQRLAYTEDELSKNAEVSERTLQRVLPKLVRENLVKRERKDGIAYRYEINLDSQRARDIIQLVKDTIRENLRNPEFYRNEETNPANKQIGRLQS
jgi:transcription initiation factor IIE alpha subunit